jgi:hypothetical protein
MKKKYKKNHSEKGKKIEQEINVQEIRKVI